MLLREEINRLCEEHKVLASDICNYVSNCAELGDKEFKSVKYVTDILKSHGFKVTMPYCGLETAFYAEYGESGPKIGLLAEYDALPDYDYDGVKKNAHACGHNWIAASCAGTAIVLSKLADKFKGRIVVFGTPAEESVGRKVDMVKANAFNDVDACFQMHLNENTNMDAITLAMNAVKFEFIGRAAHAAAYPHDGINALDAVNLTFTGVSFLRQQLQSDARIHGVITDGGHAPNIIPHNCKCLFYVRAGKKQYFEEIFEKVINCARGAAIMTGCELKIDYPENEFTDLVNNSALVELFEEELELSGIWPLKSDDDVSGSTDVGNVSYQCPTLYCNVAIQGGKIKPHQVGFAEAANSEEAYDLLVKSMKTMANAAVRLCSDDELLNKVKLAFKEQIG